MATKIALRQTDPHGAAEHLIEALAIFERLWLPDAEDARCDLADSGATTLRVIKERPA